MILSCTSQKEENTAMQAIPVNIQHIVYDTTVHHQEYIGTVESENAVDVSFLIAGTIEQMHVAEGQHVDKGALLAALNTVSLGKAHELSLSALKQAQDAYRRLSAMYENKSLPEIQYIDAKTKLEQAQAGEAIARKNLQDATLRAPQSGVVGRRYVEPGTNVMPSTAVYNIMDIRSVKVRAAIPEGEISAIRTGADCEVEISALGGETFRGEVVEKGVSANPISHTYDIKIKLHNPAGRMMPGMVCRVYLKQVDEWGNGRIIVPIRAVQVDYSGKRYVWVKDNAGKAVYKEVTLGKLSGNGVQITNGLQEGDEVIVDGYQQISAGTWVSDNQLLKQ
ncbi:efflux RND transporter periplasmic adaptor subunit [Parapedobacter koreensis]|nr:efflux RND transporter periplasmic adaptor subunit [Parapedobacter koreensis]